MIDHQIGARCTGCTACAGICPTEAIGMQANHEGFLHPIVNQDACIHCGKCVNTCPALNPEALAYPSEEPVVYAAWNQNERIRAYSSSGGIFPAYAKAVLLRGGVVAGACYDEDLSVCHTLIETEEELPQIGRSKYVQSDMNDVFVRIREALNADRLVLFCGTPCQTAGLKAFLKKEYENLYTCDFICHGVISPAVYRKYIQDVGRISGSRPVRVQFKNKDYGWNRFSTRIEMGNGTVYQKDRNEDWYTMGYTKHHLYLRPSCHACEFRTIPRLADVSLGDFWGIGTTAKHLDDDKGTSVVMVNTDKGRRLMDWVKDELICEERTLDEAVAGNASLKESPLAGEFRAYFFEHMNRVRFDKLIMRIEEKSWHLTPKDKVLRELHLLKLRLKGQKP